MDASLRSESIDRTVAVVVRYATDLDHAVDVLVAEFGFDTTFCALAQIEDDPTAHRAMWTALAGVAIDVVDAPGFDAGGA